MSDTGGPDLDRLLDPDLPHSFRGLDPEAVQTLLADAVESLRAAHRREEELRSTIASLEAELGAVRGDADAVLDDAKRRGRQMVTEAQTVRRRILEDLIRRRKVLRRQIEQLRVGRERLLEAYEVVGQTVEEATSELGVALVSATAAAERAGRRLVPDDDTVTDDELHSLEAEIEAARASGLPILGPPTAAERRADAAAQQPATEGDEESEDEVPPLVEVEPVVAAFEEMRVLGPVEEDEAGPDAEADAAAPSGEGEPAPEDPAPDDEVPVADDDDAVVEDEQADATGGDPDDDEEEREPEGLEQPGPDAGPASEGDGEGDAEVPLFDRLRAEPEPEPEPPLPDLIEAEPDPEAAADEPDPVAVLADDLARRLRRALADEQNQVLDRLRQDRKGLIGLDDLLAGDDSRVVRLATVIEPRLRETPSGAAAPDLAARLAGEVADGVRAEVQAQVEHARRGDDSDLARPVREAFRAWRTDRILPLATAVAAEAHQR